MTATFLSVMTFLAGVTAVAGVYSILTDLFLRDRSRVTRRIDVEFVKRQRDLARKLSLFKDPGQIGVELQAHDDDRSVRRRFEAMVEQSGLNLTPGRLLAQAAAAGLVLGSIVGLLCQKPLAGLIAVPIGAAAAALLCPASPETRGRRSSWGNSPPPSS